MFTGIIEEIGRVVTLAEAHDGTTMTIEGTKVIEDVRLGDSIAVNGTCLTVTEFDAQTFKVGLAPETLRRTSLGVLNPGDQVNLERSMPANGRFGGHVVQGHVDTTGRIRHRVKDGDSLVVTIELDSEYLKYLVPKGYVAIDGTSLTVIDVLEDAFTLMLIAYTQEHVTLADQPVGYRPNIEVDIFGKYIERLMRAEERA